MSRIAVSGCWRDRLCFRGVSSRYRASRGDFLLPTGFLAKFQSKANLAK